MHGLGTIRRLNQGFALNTRDDLNMQAAAAELRRLEARVAQLERNNAGLKQLINNLALIPAPDFYRPGDHAAGLVNEAWIKSREF